MFILVQVNGLGTNCLQVWLVGKVHLWICAGRMNVPGAMDLTEEQRLKMTVDILDLTRSTDPRTPAIVSFDQPWAEYMGGQAFDLSPLHFADALVRAELGLAGIALEINFGYCPGGTWSRETYLTVSCPATAIARSRASRWNSSVRATKSVSQLSSRSAPSRSPWWM